MFTSREPNESSFETRLVDAAAKDDEDDSPSNSSMASRNESINRVEEILSLEAMGLLTLRLLERRRGVDVASSCGLPLSLPILVPLRSGDFIVPVCGNSLELLMVD